MILCALHKPTGTIGVRGGVQNRRRSWYSSESSENKAYDSGKSEPEEFYALTSTGELAKCSGVFPFAPLML